MLHSIVGFFWPDLKREEVTKFSLLSLTFFMIIGVYWMMRLLKDAVFFKIAFPETLGWAPGQGGLFQPLAKTWSVFVVIAMVLIYSKLVDIFKKHQLFYVICSFYAAIFGALTTLLAVRHYAGEAALGKWLLALVGWVSYFSIESFGSLIIPLFWSFTISVTDTDSAKTGFPLIIAGAQIGSIGLSALTMFTEQIGGIWRLFALATILVFVVMYLIWTFMRVIPAELRMGNKVAAATEKKKEGFIEGFVGGIRLLLTRPYLFGILIVSTFYEVVATVVDYQMKRQAAAYPAYASEAGFAKFLGIFGVCTNGLAFFMALLGTSYLMKRYGLRFCLLVYPVCFGIALAFLYGFYSQQPAAAQMLWATFGVMIVVKGLSYAVNNPTKEMMYIPTSKNAKFKAKGWVDMFGGRSAKMGGAQITNALKHDMATLMTYGTVLGMGLIGLWIAAAIYVGQRNYKLVKEGKIVE
ncbi:MAG: hypothetical protein H6679_05725 [Epsilonproteobacteria bacterium]|nr:hypothetical protein [Campylobacterota bacterium]